MGKKIFDYVIVGSGLFGSTFAQNAKKDQKKVLVLEKRKKVGGNISVYKKHGILIHEHGPHIFHTNSEKIWNYVNQFAKFDNFIYRPKVFYRGKIYSFPINLLTLHQLFPTIKTPTDAQKFFDQFRTPKNIIKNANFEQEAIQAIGKQLYDIFIYGYTKKQWAREPSELPSSIFKRIPIRSTFNDNYFNDSFQGIPREGYNKLIKNMLKGCEIELCTDFLENKAYIEKIANKVVYTGQIDKFFDYKWGKLDYRSLEFKHEVLEGSFQGNAVVNYSDVAVPWTRIIEHKYFIPTTAANNKKTIITYEYPANYKKNNIPYYPVNDQKNQRLYYRYSKETKKNPSYIFGGRLAEYKYYNMDQVIYAAFESYEKENKN